MYDSDNCLIIHSFHGGRLTIECVLCMFLCQADNSNVVSPGQVCWQLAVQLENWCLCLKENKRKEESLALYGKIN